MDWVSNSFMLGVKHAFSHKFQQYNKCNIERKKQFLSVKNNDLPGVSSGGDSMFIHHSALDLATVVLKTVKKKHRVIIQFSRMHILS